MGFGVVFSIGGGVLKSLRLWSGIKCCLGVGLILPCDLRRVACLGMQ